MKATGLTKGLEAIGNAALFTLRVIQGAFRAPFELTYVWLELTDQGWRSLPLIISSGLALGLVMTLHTRTELIESETLSPAGQARIDAAIAQLGDRAIGNAMVVGGYAISGTPGDELARSRSRAILVRNYLHTRFQLDNRSIGTVPLRGSPPAATHKESWNGICIVLLSQATWYADRMQIDTLLLPRLRLWLDPSWAPLPVQHNRYECRGKSDIALRGARWPEDRKPSRTQKLRLGRLRVQRQHGAGRSRNGRLSLHR
jgi:hypothetical protein